MESVSRHQLGSICKCVNFDYCASVTRYDDLRGFGFCQKCRLSCGKILKYVDNGECGICLRDSTSGDRTILYPTCERHDFCVSCTKMYFKKHRRDVPNFPYDRNVELKYWKFYDCYWVELDCFDNHVIRKMLREYPLLVDWQKELDSVSKHNDNLKFSDTVCPLCRT